MILQLLLLGIDVFFFSESMNFIVHYMYIYNNYTFSIRWKSSNVVDTSKIRLNYLCSVVDNVVVVVGE
jgi:hypothetical protein